MALAGVSPDQRNQFGANHVGHQPLTQLGVHRVWQEPLRTRREPLRVSAADSTTPSAGIGEALLKMSRAHCPPAAIGKYSVDTCSPFR
jgi:hypothetical protein